jgi:TPR repeat protein
MAEEQKTLSNFNELNHLLSPNYSVMETSELEKLAEIGNRDAMCELIKQLSPPAPTCFILNSAKPNPNPEKAFKWVLKLSEIGDWQGRYWLADCYFSGQYVDKADPEQAIRLIEKTAAEGDYIACVRLAYYYAHGNGVEKDFRKAITWLKKMVEHEDKYGFSLRNVSSLGERRLCPEFSFWNEEPRYKLAELYLQGGFGIEQDMGKAIEWLEKAADRGEEKCRAQFKLGECYLTGGPGLEKSYTKAIECFEEIDRNKSEYNYLRYQGGFGRDYVLSEEEKYGRQAQRQLGICHALGKGVEQDFSEAKKYFKKAARTFSLNTNDNTEMVDPRTEAELGICLYRLGEIKGAIQCFERSAEKDDALGNLWLACLDDRKNVESRNKVAYVDPLLRLRSRFMPLASCQSSNLSPDDERKIDSMRVINKAIEDTECEIDRRLMGFAVYFETQVRKREDLNLDMLSCSDEVVQFLMNRKNNISTHPSKVILALYYQDKNDEAFVKYLKQASYHADVIANYYLGNHYKYSDDHDEAERLLQMVASADLSYTAKDNYHLDERKELSYLAKRDLNDISHQKEIEEKNKELNNLVAMFAHNFLGTLQCIRSNAEHDNNPTIHLKTVKMMGGALTAFSILSADDDKLLEQLKQDNTGEMNLQQNLANNLALAISQLLGKTNKDKIVNLYLQHLRKTKQIGIETSSEELRVNKDYRKMWQALQHQWEDEFNALFSEHVELPRLQKWLTDNFFTVEITGFDSHNISFREYGITDSIFLIVFMEIFVNAFKYIDVSKNELLRLKFCEEEQCYKLICENPSTQETGRGTHKGMDFLKTIAKKLGGQFITEVTGNSFKSTFTIPSEILK